MTKATNPDAIRTKQAAAAKEAAEHEKPLLDEATEILEQIAPLADRLAEIASKLLTDYLPIHLQAIVDDRTRALSAIETARARVAAVLEA